MKAVILAGGRGTRLVEETVARPKPMVEIGGRPMLWHIMMMYSANSVADFVVCAGYKSFLIKEYFSHAALHHHDVTFDLGRSEITYHDAGYAPSWRVTVMDTGAETMTGGRLKRAARFLADEDAFCMTYGDGVANLDIAATLAFHRDHGRLATMTVVRPPARFGSVRLDGDRVTEFGEKRPIEDGYINGGFFVLSPKILSYIAGDETIWEREPLERLASQGQLAAFRHDGFWQPMDTLRDHNTLEQLWASGAAPWKVWT